MAFSAKRKIGAKRKLKDELGLGGLSNLLPDVPTPKQILRELLTGIFARYSRRKAKIQIQTTYDFSSQRDRKAYKKNVLDAYYQACYVTTLQSSLSVLGEVIFSTPIITSALAQGWQVVLGNVASAFDEHVQRMNHGQVFSKAQVEAQGIINRAVQLSKQHKKKFNVKVTNPAPYLTDARTPQYWDHILRTAWKRQSKELQRVFDQQITRLFGK